MEAARISAWIHDAVESISRLPSVALTDISWRAVRHPSQRIHVLPSSFPNANLNTFKALTKNLESFENEDQQAC